MNINAKNAFKTHPSVDTLYETKDGMLFFKEQDAIAHSADLKDKKITPIRRVVEEDTDKEPKALNSKSTVDEIKAYMDYHKIAYTDETRAGLLELIEKSEAPE